MQRDDVGVRWIRDSGVIKSAIDQRRRQSAERSAADRASDARTVRAEKRDKIRRQIDRADIVDRSNELADGWICPPVKDAEHCRTPDADRRQLELDADVVITLVEGTIAIGLNRERGGLGREHGAAT